MAERLGDKLLPLEHAMHGAADPNNSVERPVPGDGISNALQHQSMRVVVRDGPYRDRLQTAGQPANEPPVREIKKRIVVGGSKPRNQTEVVLRFLWAENDSVTFDL